MSLVAAFPSAFLLILLVLTSAVGCDGKGIKAPQQLVALTKVEAAAFASKLEGAVNKCDKAELAELLKLEAMMRAGILGSDAINKNQGPILKSLKSNMEFFEGEVCDFAKSGGITLLGQRTRGDRQTLLYRSGDEVLNYIEFYVGKNSEGIVFADDVYSYINGQSMAEGIQESLSLRVENKSDAEKFRRVQEVIEKDPKLALATLAELPESVRHSKALMLVAVKAASQIDSKTLKEHLSAYTSVFPGDLAGDLVSYEGLVLRKQHQAAAAIVERLNKKVGGDAYLQTLRVHFLLEDGKNLKLATTLSEELVLSKPKDEDAHYLLLASHVANKNFGGAIVVMRLMGERFGHAFDKEGMAELDGSYEAFMASPEWDAYVQGL